MPLTDPFTAEADPDAGPWQVLADGARTGQAAVFGEAHLPPRSSGPNLHVHSREDESVYVIAGTLTVQIGTDQLRAGPGTLVWLPREVPHTFANLDDEPVHAFGVTTPAGLEGMFAEQAAYFSSLTGPPDEDVIDELGERYGVRRVGPPLSVDAPAD